MNKLETRIAELETQLAEREKWDYLICDTVCNIGKTALCPIHGPVGPPCKADPWDWCKCDPPCHK